jgi:hypothetical protein
MEQLEIGTLLEGDQELCVVRPTRWLRSQSMRNDGGAGRGCVLAADHHCQTGGRDGAGDVSWQGARRLEFVPTAKPGWRFERTDLAHSLDIEVSVRNVWTTARNIVLVQWFAA